MPTTTCLINHFNYGDYIEQAVRGALSQEVPFDEIVIVDDGSDPGALEAVRRAAALAPRIRLIEKPNGGQLSAFNTGFEAVKGDIVFFLDADDVYEPDYTRTVLEAYAQEPTVGFVYCGYRKFGDVDQVVLAFPEDRDLGHSAIYTLARKHWLGAPTSCLSMRRTVLERVLPLKVEQDWRTRADDCLVFGASIAGARKYYLARPLVRYRVHGSNAWYGKPYDAHADYRRKLAINRLFAHLVRKSGYDREWLAEFAHRELRTVNQPTRRQVKHYVQIAMRAPVPLGRRFAIAGSCLSYFLFESRSRRLRRAGKSWRDPRERSRDELLRRLPRRGVGAELGVWRGEFSRVLLHELRPMRLHLVDPWTFMPDDLERWYGGVAAASQDDMDRIFGEVERAFRGRDNVVIHRGLSDRIVDTFDDDYFDWIYIDGKRSYDFVMRDLELYRPKVKRGGFLAGDDYDRRQASELPVKQAVHDFVAAGGVRIDGIFGSQFALRRVD